MKACLSPNWHWCEDWKHHLRAWLMIIQSSLLPSCGARGTTRHHLPPGGHHLLRPLPYLHPGGAGGTAGGGGVRDNTSASGAKSVSEEVFRELFQVPVHLQYFTQLSLCLCWLMKQVWIIYNTSQKNGWYRLQHHLPIYAHWLIVLIILK